jgi:hypothetical protein
MPKKLMQDVYVGKENKENNQMAEFMRFKQDASANSDEVAQETPDDADAPTEPTA